jgi:hypothetical protein
MSAIFYIIHPPKIATRDPLMAGDPVLVEVPVVRGKNLKRYFHDLRLNSLRTGCRMTLDPKNVPLRTSYVPGPGDVVRMERTKAFS